MIDILIAHNNPIVAEGLKTIVQSKMRNRVLGVVNSIEHLCECSKRYFPDIVVIDYSTGQFGLDAVKKLKRFIKSAKILAITPSLAKQIIHKSLSYGVDSYLLDDCDKQEILEAVEDTFNGKQFYCGMVINILSEKNQENTLDCDGISLSEREIEIIKLISDGLTNKEIADKLYLSTHTVNTHRKNIMHKLNIKNTAGIVIYAVKENIINT